MWTTHVISIFSHSWGTLFTWDAHWKHCQNALHQPEVEMSKNETESLLHQNSYRPSIQNMEHMGPHIFSTYDQLTGMDRATSPCGVDTIWYTGEFWARLTGKGILLTCCPPVGVILSLEWSESTGSLRNILSVCRFLRRQSVYRLQKSLHNSFTFSSSNRWSRRTVTPWIIWNSKI